MTTFEKGQRVAYGPPPHDDRAFIGKVVTPGDEQSLIKWDNGNETSALNKWLTLLPAQDKFERVRMKAPKSFEVAGQQALQDAATGIGATHIYMDGDEPVAKTVKPRKSPPDDLPERLKDYDPAALKQFAKNNGVWQDKYADLPNPGLVRMNIVNRLRAKVKHGHKVVWK